MLHMPQTEPRVHVCAYECFFFLCVCLAGCMCMHTELNEHSHLYVLSSSLLLAAKTDHDLRLKVSTPSAQVCACPLHFTWS